MLQHVAFLVILSALVHPADTYLHHVFEGERTWLDSVLCPVERGIYRLTSIDAEAEMDWRAYAALLRSATSESSVFR